MDALLVSIAFAAGYAAQRVGLPPLVGFLAAGFALHALDFEGGGALEVVSDLGVQLLLFTIGLKLRLRGLLRPEIWAGASLHLAVTVTALGALLVALAASSLPLVAGLSWQSALAVAFALSFSSTVFAVKVLEEKGESSGLYGRTAVGILILQDLFAVAFLTASTGSLPSPWALLLLALPLLGPGLSRLLERSGHDELLVLFGFVATVLGASLFEAVHLKADLGALVAGILLAGSARAGELAKVLMGFKDLLLIGFFLGIGLGGLPPPGVLGVAALLALAVPFKAALFFALLVRFGLRARTSFMGALALASYSEFGLIVAGMATRKGWLADDWLAVIAIALSISFVGAAALNTRSFALFERWRARLRRLERPDLHPDDRPIDPGDAEIVVFGMGRVGQGAYDAMRERYGNVVLGVDHDSEVVRRQCEQGRKIVLGDPTDCDFWERTTGTTRIRSALLAMSDHDANLAAIAEIRRRGFAGMIAAIARHDDEVRELERAGARASFNYYANAGLGFAESVMARLEPADARGGWGGNERPEAGRAG